MSALAAKYPLVEAYAAAIRATAALPPGEQVPAIGALLFEAASRGQFVTALIGTLVVERADRCVPAGASVPPPS